MADVLYKSPEFVVLKVKVPRDAFDALETAYGSQGRALRAFRQDLPHQFAWLTLDALSFRPADAAAASTTRGNLAKPAPRGVI